MDAEQCREYCMHKPGATEDYPFGPDTLVIKVGGKMFALFGEASMNLKCAPDEAILWREQYPELVIPGYHMNKRHWNTILLGQGVADEDLCGMMDDSYDLVLGSLTKKQRMDIVDLPG